VTGPDNFRARWRKVREDLGVPDVTSHSFRKSLATLIDDEGLSARIGADHLGHAGVRNHGHIHGPRAGAYRGCGRDRRINDE
jgi:integrase